MNARTALIVLGALGGLVLTAEAGLRIVGMLSAVSDPLRIEAAPRAERVLVVGDAASHVVAALPEVGVAVLDELGARSQQFVATDHACGVGPELVVVTLCHGHPHPL